MNLQPRSSTKKRLAVVYCLTSSGGDIYEVMTRASIATLRHTNPGAYIKVACDQETFKVLQDCSSQLFLEADAVCAFNVPEGGPAFRNRFIKTQLRLLIDGPFLFLDSDTVIRKPLAYLLQINADLAAATNHSADTLAEQIWSDDQANLDTMGWQVQAPYVNGGVIWYADTPGAHRFAEAWHQNWLANVEQTGRYRDQPALNYSLQATRGIRLQALDHQWNAQILMNPGLEKNAVIWHTYSSIGVGRRDHFSLFCRHIRPNRPLTPDSRLVRRLVTANSFEIPAKPPLLWKGRIESRLRCYGGAVARRLNGSFARSLVYQQ